MRIPMLTLAAFIACVAAPAPAQTVIEFDSQKAPPAPTSEQDKNQVPEQIPEQVPAQTKENAPPVPPSRFTFTRVDSGFLRLDNDSGQVAFCRAQSRGWACQPASEIPAALEAEIANLQADVTALKKLKPEIGELHNDVADAKKLQLDIARLQDEVAGLKKEITELKEPQIKLPTREEMARARAFIQDAWHRLVDMINTVQKDMMRKG